MHIAMFYLYYYLFETNTPFSFQLFIFCVISFVVFHKMYMLQCVPYVNTILCCRIMTERLKSADKIHDPNRLAAVMLHFFVVLRAISILLNYAYFFPSLSILRGGYPCKQNQHNHHRSIASSADHPHPQNHKLGSTLLLFHS